MMGLADIATRVCLVQDMAGGNGCSRLSFPAKTEFFLEKKEIMLRLEST